MLMALTLFKPGYARSILSTFCVVSRALWWVRGYKQGETEPPRLNDLSGVTELMRWQDPNPFTLLVSQLPLPSPHPATYHLHLGPLPQHTPSEQSPHGWVAT